MKIIKDSLPDELRVASDASEMLVSCCTGKEACEWACQSDAPAGMLHSNENHKGLIAAKGVT